ncbi:hypothetical protein [Yinghuangia seranimata]|uniref:hypothetical protein n=1 Tax=Yinghuangia seranimata TaxID=408067 RepID=UPI00248C0E19|nr:hypothetical protein [Yinghuangia seranimata]MDI2128201.1 hypothetical protein [Yinghuangia seranimata]
MLGVVAGLLVWTRGSDEQAKSYCSGLVPDERFKSMVPAGDYPHGRQSDLVGDPAAEVTCEISLPDLRQVDATLEFQVRTRYSDIKATDDAAGLEAQLSPVQPLGAGLVGIGSDLFAWVRLPACTVGGPEKFARLVVRDQKPAAKGTDQFYKYFPGRPDNRARVAALLVDMANGVYRMAKCSAAPLPVPTVGAQARKTPTPASGEICGLPASRPGVQPTVPTDFQWTGRDPAWEECLIRSPGDPDDTARLRLWVVKGEPARLEADWRRESVTVEGMHKASRFPSSSRLYFGSCSGVPMFLSVEGRELWGAEEQIFAAYAQAVAEREGCALV